MAKEMIKRALTKALVLIVGLTFVGTQGLLASEEEDEGYETLAGYMDAHGTESGDGWRAAAVQVDDQRYLVVQAGEDGDIYQLSNFDDVYVEDLNWATESRLVVRYEQRSGDRFRTTVQIDTPEAEAPSFSVLRTTRAFDGRNPGPGMNPMPPFPGPVDQRWSGAFD
ncbi:MAG: hypothetical protein AAGH19_11315 [Pseudomonadota bacterium]